MTTSHGRSSSSALESVSDWSLRPRWRPFTLAVLDNQLREDMLREEMTARSRGPQSPRRGHAIRWHGPAVFYNLFVNLLLLTNDCQQRGSTDYALGVAHNTSHILSGKRHVEPTIGCVCVLRFNSEKSVIVAALTLASPMTPFSRLLSHEHYLSVPSSLS